MKIAIIGAGVAGLAAALECERSGISAEIYERDSDVGWPWPSVSFWPTLFFRDVGDPRKYMKDTYNIDFTPLNECKSYTMKSANKEVRVEGNLGYFMSRGKSEESMENQFRRKLTKTPIFYNKKAHFKELAEKYDYVIVATGKPTEARELGVWEDAGDFAIMGGLAMGGFDPTSSTVYFNTDYAGTGYGRITPFNESLAIVGLYITGITNPNASQLFEKFLQMEKLDQLEYIFKIHPPVFSSGRVTKFRVGNVFLIGHSAGLTERVLGVGSYYSLESAVLAIRSIVKAEDYNSVMKVHQKRIENISAFREILKDYKNEDFDNLLSLLGTPGVKQLVYNAELDTTNLVGSIVKLLYKTIGNNK